jgi:MoxR-like ATPase
MVRDIRLAMCDPTDLRGIPFYDPEQRIARWAPPEFLPKDGHGVIFLDELNAAPPAVQAAAYQLVLDRKLGEYTLPEGYRILAAGNRQSDLAVVYRMPSPLANRFCHLELEPDLESWRRWAYARGLNPAVAGFLSFRPQLLLAFDREKAGGAFPTPRSWEFVARILSAQNLPEESRLAAISGCVGQAAAIELLAFLEVASRLPDANAILDGKYDSVPAQLSVIYALVGSLIYALRSNPSPERRDRFVSYTMKLPAEFAVLAAREALAMKLPLGESPRWARWIERFGDLVL